MERPQGSSLPPDLPNRHAHSSYRFELGVQGGRTANSAVLVLFGLALCLPLCGPAGAQETGGPPLREDRTVVSSGSAEEPIPGIKSGKSAFWWSFLGTGLPTAVGAFDVYRANSSDSVVPGILLVGGLLIGPSLGHFYAGRPGRAWRGIGFRALAGTGVAIAIAETLGESTETHLEVLGGVCLALGGVVIAWDIVRAPHSAHVHNDEVREARTSLGVAPSIGSAGLGLRADVSW